MNPYENMTGYLNSIFDLNSGLRSDIENYFYRKTINKDGYFLKAGEDLLEVGFINKGLSRYFYISSEGKESTKYFPSENYFV